MYIVKNALKCISRAKGRNALIGVIVLVIAVSACIGLSIRQAAENAKSSTLESLSVTATISFDRQALMSEMGKPTEGGGGFDRDSFRDMMGQSSSLTLDEYEKYAKAESVKDFYYSLSASLNGNDELSPVSTEEEEDDNSGQTPQFPGQDFMGGKNMMKGMDSDFSITGYNSESAMTAFIDGTASVADGEIFSVESDAAECIISNELAEFNDIAVGDTISLINPNNEEEDYEFKVVGLYTDSSANEQSFSMMGATSTDPANKIYTSAAALQKVIDASSESAVISTDENTGREFSSEVTGSLVGTYVFASVEDYESFEAQVRDMGLDEKYTVSSSDITQFENSLVPLNTLSTMAGYFLIVVLIIGAIILIVLNIFNIRERKYEIGVLTAMGMKKGKVALQFLCEIFAVTLVAVMLGAVIGGVSAVPVTNALLENQVISQSSRADEIEKNFGRGEMPQDMPEKESQAPENMGMGQRFEGFMQSSADYVTEINSAMDITVVLQLLLIAVGLTVAAGAVGVLFVMRYDPLKILANRD